MNKMYTPTAYFFARVLAALIMSFFSPLVMSIIIYLSLGIPLSPYCFILFLLTAVEITFIGVGIGHLAGVLFDDFDNAKNLA